MSNSKTYYSHLSIEQMREVLDYMELNYSLAMEGQASGLAWALWCKINSLKDELVAKIAAEDPYTTEADARYFEGV